MKKIVSILLSAIVFMTVGCSEDYLERTPTNSVAESDMFSDLTGAMTVLDGIHRATYYYYGAHDLFGQKAIDLIVDVMGEDLFQNERGYGWFVGWYQYVESRNINSAKIEFAWSYYYDLIDNANLILDNIDGASDIAMKTSLANNIKAQALTYRAFSFYQLVQLFSNRYEPGGANSHAGVPLVIASHSDPQARATVAEVYTQINKDLDDAIKLFQESTTSRPNKSHINLNIAQGVKARVALTTGNYAVAIENAQAAKKGYALTSNYGGGFNDANDSEWLWGAVLIDEQQTSYASFFSQIDPMFGGYATLGNHKLISTELMDFMADTDIRKQLCQPEIYMDEDVFESDFSGKERVGYKFSGYGEWTNDYLYMRAGEMYLIEAEANARLGKNAEAQGLIYTLVVARDPEYTKPALTGEDLIQHILLQRRCELWGEGQRLFDIKRLNIPMDRRGKGHTETFWDAASNYPAGSKMFNILIPKQEMDSNPLMVQNEL